MNSIRTDSLLVFRRALRLSLRNPVWVVVGLTQPVLYLALFGPLLDAVSQVPGFPPGDSWQVFVPGLLVQLGVFGALFVGFGLIAEYRAGVIERMRVTPASRTALLLGRVLHDVVVLVFQSLLLIAAALVAGLRAPWRGMALGLVLTALLGAALSSASYAVALTVKNEDALAPLLNSISVPLLLLSGILLPMSLAPGWLKTVADINPITHIVNGIRAVFRGDLGEVDVLWGAGLALALAALGIFLGRRTFARQSS